MSGLAIGIDAAAHEGALEAGGVVVGVVATGLDVEYPRRHVALYRRVRAAGLVLGETGFGDPAAAEAVPGPQPDHRRARPTWSSSSRRRCAVAPGSRRSTRAQYGRPVFAVPGSRRNASAEGTNALLADGAEVLLDWSDVVLALGLTPAARRTAPARARPSRDGEAVVGALAGEPASPDQLVSRTNLPPERVAMAIADLERTRWVRRDRGWVWPC